MGFAPSASAQTAPPPCEGEHFHDLDFWLGDWTATWDAFPGQPAGQGSNHVTREFGGCVVHEHFVGGPSTGDLLGESWSVYHAPVHRWRQTWVDNQGGYFALSGGAESPTRFVLTSYGVDDNRPRQRMVFENITHNAFTWRWQSTTDQGATWTDSWVIQYRRSTAP